MKVDISITIENPELTLVSDAMTLARLMNSIEPSKLEEGEHRKEIEELKKTIHSVLEDQGFYTPIKEDLSSMVFWLMEDIDCLAFCYSKQYLNITLPNKEITALKIGKRCDILVNENLKLSFEPETIWELKRALEQYV